MKLHLPSILLTLVAIPAATYTASADVIGNGVVYDVGKNHYADNPSGEGYIEDSMQCWAVAASNVVQYWQDTYYDERDSKFKEQGTTDVPNGTIESPYAPPTGTRYLEVYEKELANMTANNGGESANFIDWWMKGINETTNLRDKEAYYSTAFASKERAALAYLGLDDAYDIGGNIKIFYAGEDAPVFKPEGLDEMHVNLTNFIVEAFKTQGQSVTLNINYGHAITCWGYETDNDGLLTALILTDGDDAQFGAFRVTVAHEQADSVDMSMFFGPGALGAFGERLVLKTDDGRELQINMTYGEESPKVKPWVSGAARIDTPAGIADPAEDAKPTIDAGEELKANTRLLASQEVAGDGIVVGDGEQAMILTSAKSAQGGAAIALSLDGATASGNNTGMTLQEGSMVSLYNLSVENYKEGGIQNGTKLYLHNGVQDISNNEKDGNGAGVSNENFFELQDNASVSITNNTSTADGGKGGGIFNAEKATVSIHGNSEVTFSGNSAANGNDIYNSANGIVNIADNDAVSFVGDSSKKATDNVAIVNEGELYLAAGEGKQITFDNSTLETTGKTYIGRDKSNWSADTAGAVQFTDKAGSSVSIKSNSDDSSVYATLENLSVSATAIAGAGDAGGTVSNAMITSLGGLTVNNLKLDTTDCIIDPSRGDVALDTVVFDLTNAPITDGRVDLTQMLTGNFTFENVSFLMNGEIGDDVLENLYFDLSSAYTEAEKAQIKLFANRQGEPVEIITTNVTFAFAQERLPEPATCTLSLLALCALAARRRRK